jgi:hypothetical protein
VVGTGKRIQTGLKPTPFPVFNGNDTPALISFVPGEKGATDKVAIKMGDKQFDLTRIPAPKSGE